MTSLKPCDVKVARHQHSDITRLGHILYVTMPTGSVHPDITEVQCSVMPSHTDRKHGLWTYHLS